MLTDDDLSRHGRHPCKLASVVWGIAALLFHGGSAALAQTVYGNYGAPIFSGGTAEPGSLSYYANPSTYPGWGAYAESEYGTDGAASASGTVTATFAYEPAGSWDVPPESAIVSQFGIAQWWSGGGPDPPFGTCSDGLGNPEVDTSTEVSYVPPKWADYGVSETTGSIFSVEGGGSIVLTVNPAAYSPAATGESEVFVDYNPAVAPVQINLMGVTLYNGAYVGLCGQRITASVSAGPLNVTPGSVVWTVSSPNAIEKYDPGLTSGQVVPLSTSDLTANGLSFYDGYPNDAVTVSCTATVTLPGGGTLPIAAMAPVVTFELPTSTWGSAYSFGLVDDQPVNFGGNIHWGKATITLPDPFTSAGGNGYFAQVITKYVGSVTATDPPYPAVTDPLEPTAPAGSVFPMLDTSFPYPVSGSFAVGSTGDTGDEPTSSETYQLFSPPANYVKYNSDMDQMECSVYLMYAPPGGIAVPLRLFTWKWNGSADFTGGYLAGSGAPIWTSPTGGVYRETRGTTTT
jgi:hypothetical protein